MGESWRTPVDLASTHSDGYTEVAEMNVISTYLVLMSMDRTWKMRNDNHVQDHRPQLMVLR